MSKVYVISGAGISVESGVRAFRTDTDSGKAMWDEYDLEEVCNIRAFNGNFYYKTHSFYNKRREELATVEPNLAHARIAEWYNKYPGQVFNITTNVDDLLERAGIAYNDVLHVHGYLRNVKVKTSEEAPVEVLDVGYTQVDPDQYFWAKPDVIFFGEMAPNYSKMYEMMDNIGSEDLILLVGCSNQVINFIHAVMPLVLHGTKLIVINPQINMSDRYQMEGIGIEYVTKGAVDAFSDPELIEKVEAVLDRRLKWPTFGSQVTDTSDTETS